MASFSQLRTAPYGADELKKLGVSLTGKSVLITGASRGVGLHIAEAFAEAGASPITLLSISSDKINATKQALSAKFPDTNFKAFAVDVCDEAAVTKVFDTGAPDILVNNAGYFPDDGPFISQDLGPWWRGFQINILGTANVIQKFLRARKEPAIILNTSTLAAHFRFPLIGWSGYTSSKVATVKMTEFIRLEHPNVRFINIHPGMIESDGFERSGAPRPPTMTDGKLAGQFFTWATTDAASFLNGRFVWAEWDIEELIKKKGQILEKDQLLVDIDGFDKGM